MFIGDERFCQSVLISLLPFIICGTLQVESAICKLKNGEVHAVMVSDTAQVYDSNLEVISLRDSTGSFHEYHRHEIEFLLMGIDTVWMDALLNDSVSIAPSDSINYTKKFLSTALLNGLLTSSGCLVGWGIGFLVAPGSNSSSDFELWDESLINQAFIIMGGMAGSAIGTTLGIAESSKNEMHRGSLYSSFLGNGFGIAVSFAVGTISDNNWLFAASGLLFPPLFGTVGYEISKPSDRTTNLKRHRKNVHSVSIAPLIIEMANHDAARGVGMKIHF